MTTEDRVSKLERRLVRELVELWIAIAFVLLLVIVHGCFHA